MLSSFIAEHQQTAPVSSAGYDKTKQLAARQCLK